jgi:hypothetical protein
MEFRNDGDEKGFKLLENVQGLFLRKRFSRATMLSCYYLIETTSSESKVSRFEYETWSTTKEVFSEKEITESLELILSINSKNSTEKVTI